MGGTFSTDHAVYEGHGVDEEGRGDGNVEVVDEGIPAADEGIPAARGDGNMEVVDEGIPAARVEADAEVVDVEQADNVGADTVDVVDEELANDEKVDEGGHGQVDEGRHGQVDEGGHGQVSGGVIGDITATHNSIEEGASNIREAAQRSRPEEGKKIPKMSNLEPSLFTSPVSKIEPCKNRAGKARNAGGRGVWLRALPYITSFNNLHLFFSRHGCSYLYSPSHPTDTGQKWEN